MDYKIFEYPITILPIDIDEQEHVNNISYLKWVQEVAIAHWTAVSSKEQRERYLWVVSRHEIDYLKQAYIGSKLIAKTWVTEPQGAKSDRFVDIIDMNTNTTIAKVKTTWYLLDFKTKRAKRIDAEIVEIFA